jgi:undecaprenyl-diphosphatase
MPIWHAVLLGFLEGLTEFIPVSSTGHILLAGHFLGFHSPGKSFEVLIQLGAIMAVLFVYFRRLFEIARGLPTDEVARRFVISVLVAFLPAAVIGLALHGFIKGVLFHSPALICTMLILGGIILLFVDRLSVTVKYRDAREIMPPTAFRIGLFQCLAMVPGVSRSGATIAGGLLLGMDKRSAAEFSFFLAMPTMVGAFALDLYKSAPLLSGADFEVIAVGFVTAFAAAAIVVRYALTFIGNHGFAPFAWWRIAVGCAGLIGLAAGG